MSGLLARARRNCVASIIVLLSMNVSMRSGMTVLRIEKTVFCDCLCVVCGFSRFAFFVFVRRGGVLEK